MSDREYLARQKTFWDVATVDEARFDRVDTRTDRTEASWEQFVDEDLRHLFDGIEPPRHGSVLELGCGVGRLLLRVRTRLRPSVNLIGVDISESMIRFSREAAAGLDNVSLHVTDGARLPLVPDSSVTFAYSLHVFIHISDTEVVRSYLRELNRVMVSGARFRFNVRRLDLWRHFGWTPGAVLARARYLTGIARSGERTWQSGDPAEFNGIRWRAGDLTRELERAGFRVLEVGPKYDEDELWCDCEKR